MPEDVNRQMAVANNFLVILPASHFKLDRAADQVDQSVERKVGEPDCQPLLQRILRQIGKAISAFDVAGAIAVLSCRCFCRNLHKVSVVSDQWSVVSFRSA